MVAGVTPTTGNRFRRYGDRVITPVVRRSAPGDAAGIAAVHVRSWRETYAHLLSPAFLAGIDVDARTQMWQRALDRDPGRVHVADVDGEIVGFAAVRRPDDGPRALELAVLYLLAAHHGSGLGQALLDAAVGDERAFCWVAEDNPRARAFYARNGFRPDGGRNVVEEWEGLAEVRLVR
jgi:ribosomal protein S18 acetylase RimI-like enzyme